MTYRQNTREEEESVIEEPWRQMVWTNKRRTFYTDYVQKYKPMDSDDVKARILLIGPIGAGKSSFFNSVKSVFKGHITSQAISGSSYCGVTTQFRAYSIKDGQSGRLLPLTLCDTMGLHAESNKGIHTDDIVSIINGHMPDHYKFSTSSPLEEKTSGFVRFPNSEEKIHCVTYVIDALEVSNVPYRLRHIRDTVNKMGIPQLVLMTNVDQACPSVAKDIRNVYRSRNIRQKAEVLRANLGVPLSCIFPVKNYSTELEVDQNSDVLLLSAVVQMLHFADDFFDELSSRLNAM